MTQDEERTSMDWEARFRADDAPWERGRLHPAFGLWAEAGFFEEGRSIFIPGCGRSLEPEALARAGLKVTAMDVAETAIAWQMREIAAAGYRATLMTGDALDYRPEKPFDLYYEQTFLCAIHPHQRVAYEQAAFEQVASGGHLLALFMQKEARGGPPYGCDMDDMRALFPSARWRWPDLEEEGGEPQAFPHPSLGGKAELAVALTRR